MENMEFALNLLLAGIVIVFFVLILLIVIITIYGKIVQTAQNASKKKKEAKKALQESEKPKAAPVVSAAKALPEANGKIPGEIIAVIAAAVDSLYGEKPVKIKSIKRSKSSGSAWRNAGLWENTKPF